MTEHLSNTELKRLHRQWRKKTDYRVSLIIDGVQGPYNIGSIIRSAAAKRVNSIWFASGATTPSNVKSGKTAFEEIFGQTVLMKNVKTTKVKI